mgnify:CR=1 FL=1
MGMADLFMCIKQIIILDVGPLSIHTYKQIEHMHIPTQTNLHKHTNMHTLRERERELHTQSNAAAVRRSVPRFPGS